MPFVTSRGNNNQRSNKLSGFVPGEERERMQKKRIKSLKERRKKKNGTN